MVDTAVFFGANEVKAKEELSEVLDFEMKLANISAKREDRRNKTRLYNPTTIGEMKVEKGLPESWVTYVQALLDHPGVKINVDENEIIIIRDVEFFKNVSRVMSNVTDRVLANYVGEFYSFTYSDLNLKSVILKISLFFNFWSKTLRELFTFGTLYSKLQS